MDHKKEIYEQIAFMKGEGFKPSFCYKIIGKKHRLSSSRARMIYFEVKRNLKNDASK